MKISSRTAVLCTVLIAATASSSVEASSRKIIRNGRAERKRALIKVNAENEDTHESKQESEEMLEIAEANIARSLMGMSMSMHMSDDESGSGSGSGGGSGSGSGSGSSSDDSTGSGGGGSSSEDSDGSVTGGGSSSDDSTGSSGDSDGDGEDKSDSSTRPDVISNRSGDETGEGSSGEEPPQQAPLTDGSGLNAPTSEMLDPAGVEESGSVSSRNVVFAAIATSAMVVPLLF